jgi:8-oxo-dGTP diphosphatase
MEPKMFVATKAFIVFNGKVLIVRESGQYIDGTQAGNYDTPGGRVQPGQSFDESLLREVREETGLEIKIGKPVYVNESCPVVRGEQWQIVRIFFACEAASDQVVLSEDHDAFEWINPREYRNYNLIPNLLPAFEAYLAEKVTA